MSFSGIINTLRSISHPDVVVDVLPATPLGAPVVHTPTVAPAQVNPPASITADADDEGTAFKALNRQDWDDFVSEMSATPSGSAQVNPPESLAADVAMTIREASVVGYESAPPATIHDLASSQRIEEGYSTRNIEVNRAAEAAFEAGAVDIGLTHAAKGHGKGLRLMETFTSRMAFGSVAPASGTDGPDFVRMDVDDTPGETPRDNSPASEVYSNDWTRAAEGMGDNDGIVHETSQEVMGNSTPGPMSSLLPVTSSWTPSAQLDATGDAPPTVPAVDMWNSFASVDGHSQGTLTVTLNDQMQVAEQLYCAPHSIASTLEDPSALRSDYLSIISPPDPGYFAK